MIEKELIEDFIIEMKQQQFLNKLYKQNTIKLDNYFKYSGTIEKPQIKTEVKRIINNVNIINVTKKDSNLVLDHYYQNSNSPLQILAKKLNLSTATVRKILSKHFENNLIKK